MNVDYCKIVALEACPSLKVYIGLYTTLVGYNVPLLLFVFSYIVNASHLRRTLFSLSYVNCFRDDLLKPLFSWR